MAITVDRDGVIGEIAGAIVARCYRYESVLVASRGFGQGTYWKATMWGIDERDGGPRLITVQTEWPGELLDAIRALPAGPFSPESAVRALWSREANEYLCRGE